MYVRIYCRRAIHRYNFNIFFFSILSKKMNALSTLFVFKKYKLKRPESALSRLLRDGILVARMTKWSTYAHLRGWHEYA
jgi:hypothetical protein